MKTSSTQRPADVKSCQFSLNIEDRVTECGQPAAWINSAGGVPDTFFCDHHKQELETDAGFGGSWFPVQSNPRFV